MPSFDSPVEMIVPIRVKFPRRLQKKKMGITGGRMETLCATFSLAIAVCKLNEVKERDKRLRLDRSFGLGVYIQGSAPRGKPAISVRNSDCDSNPSGVSDFAPSPTCTHHMNLSVCLAGLAYSALVT